jgi:hypothetical protein
MPLEENISWFVFVEGQRHGPVPSERLVTFLESHTAPHDESHPAPPVYVWREGFTDWQLASDVPELALPPPPAARGRRTAGSTGIELRPHVPRRAAS